VLAFVLLAGREGEGVVAKAGEIAEEAKDDLIWLSSA
jgi:hypothetical protein